MEEDYRLKIEVVKVSKLRRKFQACSICRKPIKNYEVEIKVSETENSKAPFIFEKVCIKCLARGYVFSQHLILTAEDSYLKIKKDLLAEKIRVDNQLMEMEHSLKWMIRHKLKEKNSSPDVLNAITSLSQHFQARTNELFRIYADRIDLKCPRCDHLFSSHKPVSQIEKIIFTEKKSKIVKVKKKK